MPLYFHPDAIFPYHARVGQVIKEVDGRNLQGRDRDSKDYSSACSISSLLLLFPGLAHEAVAKLMAERFARRDSAEMTLVVMDHKIKAGEKRRMRRYP